MPATARYFLFAIFLTVLAACNKPDSVAYKRVFDKAHELANAGKHRESVQLMDSFFAAQPTIDPEWLFDKYHFKRNYHYYNSSYDSSNLYVDSMLLHLERYPAQRDYQARYSQAMNDKGDIFFRANNLDKAFEYYYQSRKAALGTENSCAVANHSYHLGMVTYRQAKYRDAIDYFSQSYRENKTCGDNLETSLRMQELLNNIALSYTKLRVLDTAMMYYLSALSFIERNKEKFSAHSIHFADRAKAVIYGNQAKIFMQQHMHDTAEALLKKSIAINSRPVHDSLDAQFARLQLAELYLTRGSLSPQLLEEIEYNLEKIPHNDVALRLELLRSRYYEQEGNDKAAFTHLHNYIRIKDSIEQMNSFGRTNVQQLLEFQEAQSKMKLLEKNAELRELYLWLGTLVFTMLLIIAILIFHNYRKSRLNIQQLTALNQKVQEQNEDLSIALSVLEKNVREKNSLMRLVAHDLRGPVSGVAYLADRIIQTATLNDEDRKSMVIIKDASYNSMNLINELLEKKNREDHEDTELIDVAEVAKHTISLVQHKAGEKHIHISLQVPEQPLHAFIEPGKLSRVLTNIITNAIKFSKASDTIEVALRRDNDEAVITIKDHGIGIPLQYHPIVFNMPAKGRRKGTRGEKSFGLGLSICKQIIEQAKGRIWFESEEYKGTTFHIILPAEKTSKGPRFEEIS